MLRKLYSFGWQADGVGAQAAPAGLAKRNSFARRAMALTDELTRLPTRRNITAFPDEQARSVGAWVAERARRLVGETGFA